MKKPLKGWVFFWKIYSRFIDAFYKNVCIIFLTLGCYVKNIETEPGNKPTDKTKIKLITKTVSKCA